MRPELILTLLACGLILVSAAGLGAFGAARLRRRVRLLEGAAAGTAALIRQIGYLAAPLPQALDTAARCAGEAGALFTAAARFLREGDGVTGAEAWLAGAAEQGLAGEERITALAAGLGETDGSRQLEQLRSCREELLAAARQAEADYARFGKVWRSLGWCGGAVLVLLLM